MAKRSLIYSAIVAVLNIVITFIFNIKALNKTIVSNHFFYVGILILLLAATSKIISWSIHKKNALKRYKDENGREKDIIDAKYKLNIISKSFFIIGSIQMLLALLFAII